MEHPSADMLLWPFLDMKYEGLILVCLICQEGTGAWLPYPPTCTFLNIFRSTEVDAGDCLLFKGKFPLVDDF